MEGKRLALSYNDISLKTHYCQSGTSFIKEKRPLHFRARHFQHNRLTLKTLYPHITMCFGGSSRNEDRVIIRRHEYKPRYSREYVSRPEVATYRKETVTRRSTSGHRHSHDHHRHHHHDSFSDSPRRSGSRTRVITEERRSRQYRS